MIRTIATLGFTIVVFTPGCQPPPAPMASWRPVMAPDGTPAAHVTCYEDESNCMDEAQRACPQGYVVLDRNSQTGMIAETQMGPFRRATTVAEPTYRGAMLIQCRVHDLGQPRADGSCPAPGGLLFRNQHGIMRCVPPDKREQAINAGWVEGGR